MTTGTWRRGHWSRGENGYNPAVHGAAETLLPGPDDQIDLGDLGPDDMTLDDEDYLTRTQPAGPLPVPPQVMDEPEEIPADPAPGPVSEPRGRAGKRPAAAARITAATRKDIEAKLGLMLEIPGRVWAARDPYCGGTFVASIPEIRPAAVELVCQSPDLVAWFTGVGGGFMLWLNLITALQPVMYTIWAHHIAHQIGEQEQDPGQVDAGQYAA